MSQKNVHGFYFHLAQRKVNPPEIRRLTPEETVKNGEIVAVKVEGHGVILRRYNLDSEQVTLTSLEKEKTLKVPKATVEIQGIVVGVWRSNNDKN